jgi:hypothetical protein
MNPTHRFAIQLIAGILAVAALVWAFIVYQYSFGMSFTKAEIDWNRDGSTTVWEIVDAGSHGIRIEQDGSRECRVIFALQDGMPQSETCAEKTVAL